MGFGGHGQRLRADRHGELGGNGRVVRLVRAIQRGKPVFTRVPHAAFGRFPAPALGQRHVFQRFAVDRGKVRGKLRNHRVRPGDGVGLCERVASAVDRRGEFGSVVARRGGSGVEQGVAPIVSDIVFAQSKPRLKVEAVKVGERGGGVFAVAVNGFFGGVQRKLELSAVKAAGIVGAGRRQHVCGSAEGKVVHAEEAEFQIVQTDAVVVAVFRGKAEPHPVSQRRRRQRERELCPGIVRFAGPEQLRPFAVAHLIGNGEQVEMISGGILEIPAVDIPAVDLRRGVCAQIHHARHQVRAVVGNGRGGAGGGIRTIRARRLQVLRAGMRADGRKAVAGAGHPTAFTPAFRQRGLKVQREGFALHPYRVQHGVFRQRRRKIVQHAAEPPALEYGAALYGVGRPDGRRARGDLLCFHGAAAAGIERDSHRLRPKRGESRVFAYVDFLARREKPVGRVGKPAGADLVVGHAERCCGLWQRIPHGSLRLNGVAAERTRGKRYRMQTGEQLPRSGGVIPQHGKAAEGTDAEVGVGDPRHTVVAATGGDRARGKAPMIGGRCAQPVFGK